MRRRALGQVLAELGLPLGDFGVGGAGELMRGVRWGWWGELSLGPLVQGVVAVPDPAGGAAAEALAGAAAQCVVLEGDLGGVGTDDPFREYRPRSSGSARRGRLVRVWR